MSALPSTTPERIDLDAVLTELSRHGYRTTTPRRQVIAVVLEQEKPFTAEQVVALLPEIGRATVYRTLEILAGIDLLRRLLKPGGFPTYVVGQPGHRHHLVCSSCALVIEFTDCPIDELAQNLSRQTDFAISNHHLEITGLCPRCQATHVSAAPN